MSVCESALRELLKTLRFALVPQQAGKPRGFMSLPIRNISRVALVCSHTG